MRRNATVRNRPTPAATEKMITLFSMAGTWLASTCRSGSATVMIMPMRKPTTVMIHTFFRRVISEPTACPSGIMDISDPSVNSPMPAISITPPSKNATMALVKHSTSTISITGNTDVSDSCSGFLNTAKTFSAFCRFLRSLACSS